jgi:hypothetical protein
MRSLSSRGSASSADTMVVVVGVSFAAMRGLKDRAGDWRARNERNEKC